MLVLCCNLGLVVATLISYSLDSVNITGQPQPFVCAPGILFVLPELSATNSRQSARTYTARLIIYADRLHTDKLPQFLAPAIDASQGLE